MHYKTIILELLQQRPALHRQLRASRTLLPTLNRYATALKARHDALTHQLAQEKPESSPDQLSGAALEIAVQELRNGLPAESPPSDAEALSLDAAMAFVRRHTPPA
jgi:hypothetical protein